MPRGRCTILGRFQNGVIATRALAAQKLLGHGFGILLEEEVVQFGGITSGPQNLRQCGHCVIFVGTGEKVDALEPFYPDRMASRILGMGDVLSLIEKAEQNVDEDDAKRLEGKIRDGSLSLEDFLEQLNQVRRMGPMSQVLGMLPGFRKVAKAKDLNVDDRQLDRIEAIIQSMTPRERQNPDVINGSRRRRIAAGSGTSVQEVNQLLSQFKQMRKLMKQIGRGGIPAAFGA